MNAPEPLTLRPITEADLPAVQALQRLCYPTMRPFTMGQLRSQLEHFPEGQHGVFVGDELVASSSSLIVEFSDYKDWHDYRVISDNGWIRNHDPEGDTLYGIEIQVHPGWRGKRLARRLYDARKALCLRHNLRRFVIGGRIPGYADAPEGQSAEDYVEDVRRQRRHDPVLTAQLANGFQVLRVVADYLPTDEDSAGYATILAWKNPEWRPDDAAPDRRRVENVRVGLVQYPMQRVSSWDDFARKVRWYVDTASDYHADFLLFPELFTLALLSLVEATRPGAAARALADFHDRFVALLRELAVRYDVNLIGGSTFVVESGRLLNRAWLVRRDGTADFQDKIHITPSEARWWGVEGGDTVKNFDTDRGKVAVLVCYDSEFPEIVRKVVADGARILFVPYNTSDRQGFLRVRTCAHARCIENHVYAVIAGCAGHLPGVENADIHYAQSMVLTPCDIPFARDGVAAETGVNVEEILVQDLDLAKLKRARMTGTVRNWHDRRTDLYRVRVGDREI